MHFYKHTSAILKQAYMDFRTRSHLRPRQLMYSAMAFSRYDARTDNGQLQHMEGMISKVSTLFNSAMTRLLLRALGS